MISPTEFISAVVFLVCLFLFYVKTSQKYWAKRNVPCIKPKSIFGNVENPFNQKRGLAFEVKRNYNELKRRGYKHGGVYFFIQPIYMPIDIDLVKNILAKDFHHFTDRGFIEFDEKKDPLRAHLFNFEGEKWKTMRVKLTPTFTSGKMKMMFQTLLDCSGPMIHHVDNLTKKNKCLDIKDILACYTTDVIGSCAFGLEINSFKNPDSVFKTYAHRIFVAKFKDIVYRVLVSNFPSLKEVFSVKLMDKDMETYFTKTIKDVLDYRKTNNIKRNDFIHLFIQIQEKAKADQIKGLTLNEIAAQSFLFFIAGYETSSTTMTFCLHELAFNQDIQNRLREEVRETLKRNNGVLTYDAVMGMKYMDQVVNETLRKYPPVPFLNRVCNLEYKVPNTDVTIEKGTKVFISALGIHRDEEFYPNPDKFDPERFTEENKEKRPAFSFIPFGEGPRICIGLRFGLMQTKTGLSMLLNNFRILPAKTEKYSIDFEPLSFILTKKGPIMLMTESLSDRI